MLPTRNPDSRSILRWVGSKKNTGLKILPFLGDLSPFHVYVEPFAGSLWMYRRMLQGGLNPEEVWLADLNAQLMNFWACIRDDWFKIMDLAGRLPTQEITKEMYIAERTLYNEARHLLTWDQAARFYWLNKAGYNGLFRTNKAGELNTPFGKTKTSNKKAAQHHHRISPPAPADWEYMSTLLRSRPTQILPGQDWKTMFKQVDIRAVDEPQRNILVYCDPPYLPNEGAQAFAYLPGGFNETETEAMLVQGSKLVERRPNVQIVVSNNGRSPFPTMARNLGYKVDTFKVVYSVNPGSGGSRYPSDNEEAVARIGLGV